jgi:peptidoglycan hydrolase-like protein with peptidoglycan-binding domain
MGKYLAVLVILFSGALLTGCQKKSVQNDLMPAEEVVDNRMMAPEGQDTAAVGSADNTVVTDTIGDAAATATTAVQDATAALPSNGSLPTPKDIQTALKNAGYYHGDVDGNIGPKTKQAVKDFQLKNNLSSDGKVGPKTWSRLSQYLTAAGDAAATTTTVTTAPAQSGD